MVVPSSTFKQTDSCSGDNLLNSDEASDLCPPKLRTQGRSSIELLTGGSVGSAGSLRTIQEIPPEAEEREMINVRADPRFDACSMALVQAYYWQNASDLLESLSRCGLFPAGLHDLLLFAACSWPIPPQRPIIEMADCVSDALGTEAFLLTYDGMNACMLEPFTIMIGTKYIPLQFPQHKVWILGRTTPKYG